MESCILLCSLNEINSEIKMTYRLVSSPDALERGLSWGTCSLTYSNWWRQHFPHSSSCVCAFTHCGVSMYCSILARNALPSLLKCQRGRRDDLLRKNKTIYFTWKNYRAPGECFSENEQFPNSFHKAISITLFTTVIECIVTQRYHQDDIMVWQYYGSCRDFSVAPADMKWWESSLPWQLDLVIKNLVFRRFD